MAVRSPRYSLTYLRQAIRAALCGADRRIVALGGRPRTTLEIPPTKTDYAASSRSFGPVISRFMTYPECNFRTARRGAPDSICRSKQG